MNLFTFACRNLARKKIRTLLTMGGGSLAVAVLVSLMGFGRGYRQSLSATIDRMGYQLLVTAKGCPYEAATLMLKGGSGLRYMDAGIYEKISHDARVKHLSPQLVATVYDPDRLDGQGGFSLYMGITDDYLKLKPWSTFQDGQWFSQPNAEEVIMGYEAAEVEQRLVGDQIFIPKLDRVLRVVGIFKRTGTQDDGIIFLPLKTAQQLFGLPDKLTGVGIKLKELQELTAFEEDLYNEPGIQVISMSQVRGTILNLISSARVMANSVALVAIFIAAIGVINTILMSVFERTREIGIIKALGASRLEVFELIWAETMLVCLMGGLGGMVIALAGSRGIEGMIKRILPYTPPGKLVMIEPVVLMLAFAGTLILGLLAGLYPAWRASSMMPVKAIRSTE
ncbi:MAG: ABC transporter permease [Deltaproteobacteria bacterium]|nr:ABC transporter permease [Candidatus Anaeroferrophillus wilburensis]MBN2890051.1 ABC transporter permease [Deltaproteobacteria bacterium]